MAGVLVIYQIDELGFDQNVSTHCDITEASSVSIQILICSLFKNSIVGIGIIFQLYLSVNAHMKLCGSGKQRPDLECVYLENSVTRWTSKFF